MMYEKKKMPSEVSDDVREQIAHLAEVFGPLTAEVIKLAKDVYDKGAEDMRARCAQACRDRAKWWETQNYNSGCWVGVQGKKEEATKCAELCETLTPSNVKKAEV